MTPADIDRVFGRGRLRMVTGDHVEVFREAVAAGRAAPLHQALPGHAGRRLQRVDRARVAHPRAPGRPRHQAGARRRPVRPRRGRPAGAGPDLRRRRHRRPLGDAAAARARRRDLAQRLRGLRPLVGARPPQPDRARRDPRAAAWSTSTSRPTTSASRSARPTSIRTRAAQRLQPRFERHRADRLRVLARLGRAARERAADRAARPTTTTSRRACCARSRPAATATSRRRASSTGAATCSAWRRCCWRYLPELEDTTTGAWTRPRHAKARALVRRLIEAHDAELPAMRPHAELIALAGEPLAQPELARIAAARLDAGVRQPHRRGGVADAGDADRAAGDARRW